MKVCFSILAVLLWANVAGAQTLVQSTSGAQSGAWPSQTTTTSNFAAAPTVGNYIAVTVVACNGASCDPTTNGSGTYAATDTIGTNFIKCGELTISPRGFHEAIFIGKVTTSSADAVTVVQTGSAGGSDYGGVNAYEFSGTGLTNPACDVSGQAKGTISGTNGAVSTSSATTASGDFILSLILDQVNSCPSPASGYTNLPAAVSGKQGFKIAGAAATETATFSGCTNGAEYEALIGAFKNASTTCTGASPNWTVTGGTFTAIQGCHDVSAVTGDTITVPAGSYTINPGDTLNITKGVKLVAGAGATCKTMNGITFTVCYTDNSVMGNGSSAGPISITENASNNTLFKGFAFTAGTGFYKGFTNALIEMHPASSGKPIVFAKNSYDLTQLGAGSGDFQYWFTNQGVVTGNTMEAYPSQFVSGCGNDSAFIRHKLTGSDSYWTSGANWGATDTGGNTWLYVEGNIIHRAEQANDIDDNAKMVFRWNDMSNGGIGAHGVETSGHAAGRAMDVYNNNFINDNSLLAYCGTGLGQNFFGPLAGSKAGGILIHHNTIPDTITTWQPGGLPTVEFFVETLRRLQPQVYSCWATRTKPGAPVYPVPHMPGTGYITGNTYNIGPFTDWFGNTETVTQSSDPIYLWDNTGAGSLGGNYTSPIIGDYADNFGGRDFSCYRQVATAHITNGGTGYSIQNGVTTTDSGIGHDLLVNITGVSGGAVTAVTLQNSGAPGVYGAQYVVGDTITLTGAGGGNATLNVDSVKWSDATSDIPSASTVLVQNRDYFLATPQPGYSNFACPHPLAVSLAGVTGSCDIGTNGVAGYNINLATFYTAKTGSDSNTCTQAQSTSTPKLTVAGGISCLTMPGTKLVIFAGTYNEILTSFPSGVSGNPIVIQSNPGDTVIIQTPNGQGYPNHLMDLVNVSFLTFNGLIFDGAAPDGTEWDNVNIKIDVGTSNVTVQNSEVRNAGEHGFLFVDGPPGLNSVINNNIHDNGFHVPTPPPPPPFGYGIYLSSQFELISGNNIHNNARYGMQIYGQTGAGPNNNTIVDNVFHDNEQGTSGAELIIGGNNHFIYNNIFYNAQPTSQSVVQFANAGPSQIKFYNNTIYGGTGSATVGITTFAVDSLIIENNIINNVSADIQDNATGGPTTFAGNLCANGGTGCAVTGNPLFVNAAGANFHLTSGSPAGGIGTNLSSIFTTDKDGLPRPMTGPWTSGAYNAPSGSPFFTVTQQPSNILSGGTFPAALAGTISTGASGDSIVVSSVTGTCNPTGTTTVTTTTGGIFSFPGVGANGVPQSGCVWKFHDSTNTGIPDVNLSAFNISGTLSFSVQPLTTISGMTMASFTVNASNSSAVLVTLTPNGCGAGFTNLTQTTSASNAVFSTVVTSGNGSSCAFTASAPNYNPAVSNNFNVNLPTPPPILGEGGLHRRLFRAR